MSEKNVWLGLYQEMVEFENFHSRLINETPAKPSVYGYSPEHKQDLLRLGAELWDRVGPFLEKYGAAKRDDENFKLLKTSFEELLVSAGIFSKPEEDEDGFKFIVIDTPTIQTPSLTESDAQPYYAMLLKYLDVKKEFYRQDRVAYRRNN